MRLPINSAISFASIVIFFVIVVCFASNAPAKAQRPPQPATSQPAAVVEPQPVIIPAPTPEIPITAPAPAPAPATTRKPSYNSCNVDSSTVAMTFDDGPHPKLTPRLLDMLKERNIKATFS